jgi:hypothetical protein
LGASIVGAGASAVWSTAASWSVPLPGPAASSLQPFEKHEAKLNAANAAKFSFIPRMVFASACQVNTRAMTRAVAEANAPSKI